MKVEKGCSLCSSIISKHGAGRIDFLRPSVLPIHVYCLVVVVVVVMVVVVVVVIVMVVHFAFARYFDVLLSPSLLSHVRNTCWIQTACLLDEGRNECVWTFLLDCC